jgi:outer membrane protein
MKQKSVIMGAVVFAFLTASAAAQAQSAGSVYVTTGWFHLAPQDSSEPLKVLTVGGSPVNRSVPNTGAGAAGADTLGFATGYFVTDHIATEFVAGIPPKFDLNGEGVFQQFGVLGQAYQWSPALLLKYYFNDAKSSFRPYVGVGATYIWFTGAKITNSAFQQAALGGPTTVQTSNQWAPVFNAGFVYNFTDHWFAGLSLSYIPVSLTVTLTTQRPTQTGTVTQVSQARSRLDPIVSYVNVGYRF